MGLAKLAITLLPACTNSSSSSCKVGKRLRNSSRRSASVKHLLDSWGGQVSSDVSGLDEESEASEKTKDL